MLSQQCVSAGLLSLIFLIVKVMKKNKKDATRFYLELEMHIDKGRNTQEACKGWYQISHIL